MVALSAGIFSILQSIEISDEILTSVLICGFRVNWFVVFD